MLQKCVGCVCFEAGEFSEGQNRCWVLMSHVPVLHPCSVSVVCVCL